VMEGLNLGKALLVVVNTALMDDHQQELAHAMQKKVAGGQICMRAVLRWEDKESTENRNIAPSQYLKKSFVSILAQTGLFGCDGAKWRGRHVTKL